MWRYLFVEGSCSEWNCTLDCAKCKSLAISAPTRTDDFFLVFDFWDILFARSIQTQIGNTTTEELMGNRIECNGNYSITMRYLDNRFHFLLGFRDESHQQTASVISALLIVYEAIANVLLSEAKQTAFILYFEDLKGFVATSPVFAL